MRREKKFEALFKMKFHSAKLPPLEETSLIISLVPVGSENPTARLESAKIIGGACTWANLVYQTVELVEEIKTGRIRSKCYNLAVSTGISESGFLGEVSIDFADLAEATKPRKLTLPLQASESGVILHIIVQRMPGDQDSWSTQDSEFFDAEIRDHCSDTDRSLCSTESETSSEALGHERYESSGDAESDNNQMKMLEGKVEVSEMELECLKQQAVEESKKGQQLSGQLATVREERDAIKAEYEQLKSDFAIAVQKETESVTTSLNDIRKELQHEKTENDRLKLQLHNTEIASRDFHNKIDQKNEEITQLLSKIKALESELMDRDDEKLLKQTIENLYSEIEAHKKEEEDMLIYVQRLATDNQRLEKKSERMYSTLQKTEKEKMEVDQNYAEALAAVKQLESCVKALEEDTKAKQAEYSELLSVNEELEIEVEDLKKELESRAQQNEENFTKVNEARIEQEQRAIQAEEAFSEAKRDNANTVEQLQKELKQLSDEMSSEIEETEKLAQKSIAEGIELQRKNEVLESMLQKAEEENQKTINKYELYVQELEELHQHYDEMSLKIEEKEKSALESIAKANDLQGSNKVLESLLQKAKEEHQITKTEYERTVQELEGQNKRVDIEGREDLESQLAAMREEVDKLKQENISANSKIHLKSSKEVNLNLEVKKLRLKNSDLKNYLSQVVLEKEDLEKEVVTLKDSFHKIKESEFDENSSANEPNGIGNGESNSSTSHLRVLDDLTRQDEFHTAQIKSLLGEVELLKENNRSMEQRLEEMHERYSEISLRFAEVEGERQELVMALRNMKIEKKN